MAKEGDPYHHDELAFLLKRSSGRISEIWESPRCLFLPLCPMVTADGQIAATTARKKNAIKDHAPQDRKYGSKTVGV